MSHRKGPAIFTARMKPCVKTRDSVSLEHCSKLNPTPFPMLLFGVLADSRPTPSSYVLYHLQPVYASRQMEPILPFWLILPALLNSSWDAVLAVAALIHDWQHTTYCCSFTVCPGIFIPAVSLLYSPSRWNSPARELLESFMQCIIFPRVKATSVFYRVCYAPLLQEALPPLCLRRASPACSLMASVSPALTRFWRLSRKKFWLSFVAVRERTISTFYTARQDGNTLRKPRVFHTMTSVDCQVVKKKPISKLTILTAK